MLFFSSSLLDILFYVVFSSFSFGRFLSVFLFWPFTDSRTREAISKFPPKTNYIEIKQKNLDFFSLILKQRFLFSLFIYQHSFPIFLNNNNNNKKFAFIKHQFKKARKSQERKNLFTQFEMNKLIFLFIIWHQLNRKQESKRDLFLPLDLGSHLS